MQAETAYNVIQALPEAEKLRLYAMLDKDKTPAEVKAKKSNVWTIEECTELLIKHLNQQKRNRRGVKLKVVK